MKTNFIVNDFSSDKANSIRFNQDYSMFSLGTERGYKIYKLGSKFDYYENNLSGGISICEMSYKSNFLALVGGGKLPKYINKKLVIYNDAEESIESEFKFTTPVINVKFKKNLIFIVLEKKIYVFNTENCQNIDSFETIINKRGIIAVNGSPNKTIMAHPIQFNDQPDKGYVGIKNYKTNKYFPLLVHEEPISFMGMDYYGLLLATCNDKGTIIRIHSLIDKTLLYECRRGKEKAIINYICFDINYKYFGINSDRGTIHIWKLNDIVEKNTVNNNDNKIEEENIIVKDIENDFVEVDTEKKNNNNSNSNSNNNSNKNLGKMYFEKYRLKKINTYKSESSYAKIRINKPKCIFCFRPDDLVFIVSPDEKYNYAKVDKNGCVFTDDKKLKDNLKKTK